MTELQLLADRLEAAADYTDIFPAPDTVRTIYLKLVTVVHPDRYSDQDEYEMATKAFQQLTQFHSNAQQALAEDRFGEPLVTIRTKRAVHKVKRNLGVGDIAALYQTATTTEHGSMTGLLKVARNPRDNDLMGAEAKALKTLHSTDDKLTRHYPLLLDSFLYKEGRRRANVVAWQADCLDLRQLQRAFPLGIDPLHATWIWRRLLMALGFAHDQDVIHGAVLPPHVLILPSQHGVLLVDWCYSVPMDVFDSKTKTFIRALISTYKDWYPEEVADRSPASPATDIVMAARCMIWLMGGLPNTGWLPNTVPSKMRAWFKGCLLTKQSARPDNAWDLLVEFDKLLERLKEPFYPRKFIDFVVPPGMAT